MVIVVKANDSAGRPQKTHPTYYADINLDTQSPSFYILPISKQVPINPGAICLKKVHIAPLWDKD